MNDAKKYSQPGFKTHVLKGKYQSWLTVHYAFVYRLMSHSAVNKIKKKYRFVKDWIFYINLRICDS